MWAATLLLTFLASSGVVACEAHYDNRGSDNHNGDHYGGNNNNNNGGDKGGNGGNYGGGHSPRCITDAEAQHVSDGWFALTGGQGSFNATIGQALLTESFLDFSGSVSSLINGGKTTPKPLLGPTFNKTSFLAANAAQPPTPYTQLNIWHTCTTVIQRFVADLQPQPALGISIFEVVRAPKGNAYGAWQINTTYGELNSVAFLADVGYTFVPPNRP